MFSVIFVNKLLPDKSSNINIIFGLLIQNPFHYSPIKSQNFYPNLFIYGMVSFTKYDWYFNFILLMYCSDSIIWFIVKTMSGGAPAYFNCRRGILFFSISTKNSYMCLLLKICRRWIYNSMVL